MKSASQLQPKQPRPLRAYLVRGDDPEYQTIQFAATNVAARRQGAIEIDLDFGSVTCTREKWADEFANQGEIPAQAYIDNGWWVNCICCGDQVCADSHGEDEEGNHYAHQPVYCGDSLFCTPSCQAAHQAEKAAAAKRKQEVIDGALAEFPGIQIVSANDHETDRTVRFMFPGALGAATWQLGAEAILVAKRDVEAWTAYRTANPRANQ